MRHASTGIFLFAMFGVSACAGPSPARNVPPAGALEMAIVALSPASRYLSVSQKKSVSAHKPSRDAVADLAPSGTLRAAINFGNPILANKGDAIGDVRGVSVDLARELATRLDVQVELVTYSAAGKVVEGLKTHEWDVAFYAIDPLRAADSEFTAPYVIIEGAYLVRDNSPIKTNDEVDRAGICIVVGKGSAYDLYLSRELRHATLIRTATSQAVTGTMIAQNLEVAAGVKQQLVADAKRIPGLRLLDGRFMVIQQAMATPRGRIEGARYLAAFIEDMKASGFIANALKRHGIEGALVAPAGR